MRGAAASTRARGRVARARAVVAVVVVAGARRGAIGARAAGARDDALARWLAANARDAPVNGRALAWPFGVAAVPACFPTCAAAATARPEARATWTTTRDALLEARVADVEAAVARLFARDDDDATTMTHADAMLVNDERVRAFFERAEDVEGD